MNSFLEFSAGTFFGVFPKQNGTVVSLCFLLEKHFITELSQRTLIFFTYLQGRMVSFISDVQEIVLLLESQELVGIIVSLFCVRLLEVF